MITALGLLAVIGIPVLTGIIVGGLGGGFELSIGQWAGMFFGGIVVGPIIVATALWMLGVY